MAHVEVIGDIRGWHWELIDDDDRWVKSSEQTFDDRETAIAMARGANPGLEIVVRD